LSSKLVLLDFNSMTSFRFSALFRGASLLLLLAGALSPSPAFAVDDLPPPQGGSLDELPSSPEPQAPLAEDNDTPAPSLGDQDLPAPNGGPAEKNSNQVNRSNAPDNIYLPTPAGNNDINYAPVGSLNSSADYSGSSDEWKQGLSTRPIFSLSAGVASRNYATVLVPNAATGYGVGMSIRLFDVGQTVFVHGLVDVHFITVGDIAPGKAGPTYSNLRDKTYHLGGMLEIGLGRRFSLFGTLMRRWNTISYDAPSGDDSHIQAVLAQRDPAQLQFIGEVPSIRPGIGGQYDFYVIPHGSMGVQARLEQDFVYVGLTMSLEPAPRKKMSLNFEKLH
jgi:hypothetical protein